MITEKERQGLLVRWLTLWVGPIPIGFLSIVMLLALLVTAIQTVPGELRCRASTYDPTKLGLTWRITDETDTYIKFEVFDGFKSIAYGEVEKFSLDSNQGLNLEVGLRSIDYTKVHDDDQIAYWTAKVTDTNWRQNDIGKFLLLKIIEWANQKNADYLWTLNRADDWTSDAPEGFNPWVSTLSSCFNPKDIIQIQPLDLWRETLIKLR